MKKIYIILGVVILILIIGWFSGIGPIAEYSGGQPMVWHNSGDRENIKICKGYSMSLPQLDGIADAAAEYICFGFVVNKTITY
jgi:hypothetical protein